MNRAHQRMIIALEHAELDVDELDVPRFRRHLLGAIARLAGERGVDLEEIWSDALHDGRRLIELMDSTRDELH